MPTEVEKLKAEKEAIQNCEEQVLSTIGFIQPFTYLLSFGLHDNIVTHVSSNIDECLNKSPNTILGQSIDTLLPSKIMHSCNNARAHSTISKVREYLGQLASSADQYEVYGHIKQNSMILEFQKVNSAESVSLSMLDNVQRILGRLNTINTEKSLFMAAVIEIKHLTDFDRVKVYKFLPDGAGEVIAEAKDPDVKSYLGLRFPAFDIPKAARELYAKTPIRVIPSVNADQIDILTAESNAQELDLSLAVSRGVVPVHMQYLQNMGVKASMSLPIVVEGKMWGLFACHHQTEKTPDAQIISSCEILGSTISMMLTSMIQTKRTVRLERCNAIVNKLIIPDESALGFTAYWETAGPELATLIECDGIALVSKENVKQHGRCPAVPVLQDLLTAINQHVNQTPSAAPIMVVESIELLFPHIDCGESAGFIAISDPVVSYKYLLVFRNHTKEKVHWAGKPNKQIDKEGQSFRLNPRASFAEYINENEKRCDKFSDDDLIVAEALKEALHTVMSNVSKHTKNRERLGLMVRELNHRVRNILALITSIVSQSRTDSHSLEEFVESLESRIQALSETHKLLTEFDWQAIQISLLFERALSPYIAKTHKRISLNGDNVSLPPELASLFALVIHELASNASKYGALSVPGGKVGLSWKVEQENLELVWKEEKGPIVVPPQRVGFGTTLIKEALSYEFDADCNLLFLEGGVEAHFALPLASTKIETLTPAYVEPSKTIHPQTFSVLVLEDDYIVSKDMCNLLKSFGAHTTDAAPTITKAYKLLESNRYDIAILDANIRGEFSGEIADKLDQLNMPYVFVTGYGSKDQALQEKNALGILTKPVNEDELYALLRSSRVIPNEHV